MPSTSGHKERTSRNARLQPSRYDPVLTAPVLTLDVDWASDAVIDAVAGLLVERRVRSTWFVTHESQAVDRLRARPDLFELGIHPNMLPGSTHGSSESEVLTHMRTILPGATVMRTHGLYQTANFLAKAALDFGITIDASLYLPHSSHLQAHCLRTGGARLWRVPYFWEDDDEMFEDEPIWTASDPRIAGPGLRVFDFHPVHVALNTGRFERYDELRRARPPREWDTAFIDAHVSSGPGPGTIFVELVESLAGRGRFVSELADIR